MKSGELDQHIDLQAPTVTTVDGGVSTSFSTVATVWGTVVYRKGNVNFQAETVNPWQWMKMGMRYRDDITTAWRVVWMGQTFTVANVDRTKRRQGELWLECQVVGAQ